MLFLLSFHWGWLTGAVLLGLAMGWISVVQYDSPLSRQVVRGLGSGALVVVVAACVLAFAELLPGRFGYGLDLALVMLATYLAGCLIGALLRDRVVSRTSPAPDPGRVAGEGSNR
ncbi:MAG: hypothetical protein FWD68_08625 [Alphaproteobacteria bacterium]|nr:hypothetical protein [Alphaproteobacteria bacterium]